MRAPSAPIRGLQKNSVPFLACFKIDEGTDALRHRSSKQLYEYWNILRSGRVAPERSEIEPSDIREILGDTFILEVSAQMRAISFRLAGTRLCAAYGRELKGFGYLGLWAEEDNFEIAKGVSRVYADFEPTLISYTAQTASGKFIEYETILLPLMPAADGDSRILGLAAPKSMPYWVGAEPLAVNHLRTLRTVSGHEYAPSMVTEPPQTMKEPGSSVRSSLPSDPSSSDANGVGHRKVGHLTVLNGGRS